MLDLGRADAEGQRSQRPVRDVWLSPHTMVSPGWSDPAPGRRCGRCPGAGRACRRGARRTLHSWRAAIRPAAAKADRHTVRSACRSGLVIPAWRGSGRAAHLAPTQTQSFERLRRCDLMHQVQVDVQRSGWASALRIRCSSQIFWATVRPASRSPLLWNPGISSHLTRSDRRDPLAGISCASRSGGPHGNARVRHRRQPDGLH